MKWLYMSLMAFLVGLAWYSAGFTAASAPHGAAKATFEVQ